MLDLAQSKSVFPNLFRLEAPYSRAI